MKEVTKEARGANLVNKGLRIGKTTGSRQPLGFWEMVRSPRPERVLD